MSTPPPASDPPQATKIDLPGGRYYIQTDSYVTFAAELGKAVEAGCAPTGFTVVLLGYSWADSEPTRPRERRLIVSDLTADELTALAAGSATALDKAITRAVRARNSPPNFSYEGTRAFSFRPADLTPRRRGPGIPARRRWFATGAPPASAGPVPGFRRCRGVRWRRRR